MRFILIATLGFVINIFNSVLAQDCWIKTPGLSCSGLYGPIEQIPNLACGGCQRREGDPPQTKVCTNSIGYVVDPFLAETWTHVYDAVRAALNGEMGYSDEVEDSYECWGQMYCEEYCDYDAFHDTYACTEDWTDWYEVSFTVVGLEECTGMGNP